MTHATAKPSSAPNTDVCYNERAVWRCLNRHSGRVHIIHGPLAEILLAYPEDYKLRYLGQEQTSNRFS